MYLTIVILPLISAAITLLFGRFIGGPGAKILTTTSVIIAGLISLSVMLTQTTPVTIKLWTWFSVKELVVTWGFYFDNLTNIMLIVVTCISAIVHVYSTDYMGSDAHVTRFMSYLSLFTFFMLMLVTGDNLVQLFIGWEGVGVCSYLLINFWFTRVQANKSAIKAMVVNRVGDMALSLGMFGLIFLVGNLEFATVVPVITTDVLIFGSSIKLIDVVGILLFIGATGKSAQLILHTWLPDAMEGPTPVSALIHAATMVTAGVYLIIRLSPLFELSPISLTIISIVGGLTAFFAATIGLVQNDIKRIIAYSTCSQLGYMVFSAGLSNYSTSLFHLFNHAFFKALLFLSAGVIIHAMLDEQDLRRLGGLVAKLPLTYSLVLIGSLSLAGFPYLTGFYSKDVILEMTWATYSIPSTLIYWLGVIGAFCTSFYSLRLIFLTFLSQPTSSKSAYKQAHEGSLFLLVPLLILAFCSIFIGFVCKDFFTGFGNQTLLTHQTHFAIYDAEFLPAAVKNLPVIFSIFAAILSVLLLSAGKNLLYSLKLTLKPVYIFLNSKWYFDVIYNKFIVVPILSSGNSVFYKNLDRGLLEVFGGTGIWTTLVLLTRGQSTLNSGYLYNYAFTLILGLIVLVLPVLGMLSP